MLNRSACSELQSNREKKKKAIIFYLFLSPFFYSSVIKRRESRLHLPWSVKFLFSRAYACSFEWGNSPGMHKWKRQELLDGRHCAWRQSDHTSDARKWRDAFAHVGGCDVMFVDPSWFYSALIISTICTTYDIELKLVLENTPQHAKCVLGEWSYSCLDSTV